jgi:opacity protein-like surface antigen
MTNVKNEDDKMKICKIKGAVFALALSVGGTVHAGSENFEGFAAGVSGEFKSTTAEFSVEDVKAEGFGRQYAVASVFADYGIKVSESSVWLVGGRFDLHDSKIVVLRAGDEEASVSEKLHHSVYVAPGILLNDSTLGFFKLSYEGADLQATGGDSASLTGLGLGFGVRTQLKDRWQLDVEVGRIFYSKETVGEMNADTGSTLARVGLVYRF